MVYKHLLTKSHICRHIHWIAHHIILSMDIFACPPLLSLAFCNLWSKCFFFELFFPSCFCQTTLIKMLFHLLFCLLAKGVAHFQLKQKMAFKPSPRCVCMFVLGDCSCELFFPHNPVRSRVSYIAWPFYSTQAELNIDKIVWLFHK